jgi:lysozyme
MPIINRKQAGWCAIAVACVSGFEGLRTAAYADPVGIPTICFGETKGVKLGQRATVEECKGMLAESLEIANRQVDSCVRTYLPDTRRAALVSFTYNAGGANFCGSTLVRKLNAGDTIGACNELSRWTRAKGIVLPGLVKRREAERQMCLQGLS